jgi:hypothetical protein
MQRDRRTDFLKRAAECRALAATALTEDGRRVLLALANDFEEAASALPVS